MLCIMIVYFGIFDEIPEKTRKILISTKLKNFTKR